jgi:flagellar biosynthesis/type III secretory pathway M-ring protein FliF/YscJ
MPIFERTFRTIATQLRGLSGSARMLVATTVVILILSLLIVGMLTGSPAMQQLPIGPLTAEARTRAINYIRTSNIPFEEENGQILVPAEHKYTVLAGLTENQLISGEQIDFTTLMKDDSPFLSDRDKQRRYLIAKMNVLAGMISAMGDIAKASVVIDDPVRPPGIGGPRVTPSASVTVTSRTGELSPKQVDAIANLVAGAHASLKVENVAVIDSSTGRAYRGRSEDDYAATRYLELKQNTERSVQEKILDRLSYIQGVRVEVNAILDAREELQRSRTYENPKIGPLQESSRTTSSSQPTSQGEAGVRPNVGQAVAIQSGAAAKSSDERTESRTVPAFPMTERDIKDNKGYALQINATVGVPRSFLVRIYQEEQGDAEAQPDAAALEALSTQQVDRIQKEIAPLISTDAIPGAVPGAVVVSINPDFALAGMTGSSAYGGSGGAGSGGAAGADGIGGLVGGNLVKLVGLGALSAISLLMMFMMVRKATVKQPLPSAEELVGIPPALQSENSDLVGEAGESAPPLEAMEVDEGALRRQQMLDQINTMAIDRPDEAANLLRKWIRTES